jgi:hypothetical protein
MLSHQIGLRRDKLPWREFAGFDRAAQDRRQLKVQRRRVEVINGHAVTVVDLLEHV